MRVSERLTGSPRIKKLATKYSDEWVFSPLFVKLPTKFVYPVATRLMGDDVVFVDWAYEEDPAMALPLAESDGPNRAHINLYHRTATRADLSGKRVLEISCGRGGGASDLVRPPSLLDRSGLKPERHRVPSKTTQSAQALHSGDTSYRIYSFKKD